MEPTIGLDLVEIAHVRRMLADHGERFTRRVFTEGELAQCARAADPSPHLAARFAAKEAVVKLLGTGLAEGIAWKDIEVTRDAKGRPGIVLHRKAARIAKTLGIARVHVSLTHTQNTAGAVAVPEKGKTRGSK